MRSGELRILRISLAASEGGEDAGSARRGRAGGEEDRCAMRRGCAAERLLQETAGQVSSRCTPRDDEEARLSTIGVWERFSYRLDVDM